VRCRTALFLPSCAWALLGASKMATLAQRRNARCAPPGIASCLLYPRAAVFALFVTFVFIAGSAGACTARAAAAPRAVAQRRLATVMPLVRRKKRREQRGRARKIQRRETEGSVAADRQKMAWPGMPTEKHGKISQ